MWILHFPSSPDWQSKNIIIAVTLSPKDDGIYTYLRGQCKASMKKVAYMMNIKLSKDGIIEECHCDCAAGSGTQASCKHVAVLLCGITRSGSACSRKHYCNFVIYTFKDMKVIFIKRDDAYFNQKC